MPQAHTCCWPKQCKLGGVISIHFYLNQSWRCEMIRSTHNHVPRCTLALTTWLEAGLWHNSQPCQRLPTITVTTTTDLHQYYTHNHHHRLAPVLHPQLPWPPPQTGTSTTPTTTMTTTEDWHQYYTHNYDDHHHTGTSTTPTNYHDHHHRLAPVLHPQLPWPPPQTGTSTTPTNYHDHHHRLAPVLHPQTTMTTTTDWHQYYTHKLPWPPPDWHQYYTHKLPWPPPDWHQYYTHKLPWPPPQTGASGMPATTMTIATDWHQWYARNYHDHRHRLAPVGCPQLPWPSPQLTPVLASKWHSNNRVRSALPTTTRPLGSGTGH